MAEGLKERANLLKRTETLSQQVITDGLTSTYNHRYLQERLHVEIERAERYARPLSLMIVDIDRFKRSTTPSDTRRATRC